MSQKEKINFISCGGHRLHAELKFPSRQTGPAPLVILSHGFMAHSRMLFFPELRKELLARGWAVFSYDFPGHGRSRGRRSEVTLPRNITDLKNAIDILERDQRLTLSSLVIVGHCFGGMGALLLAGDEPRVKAVVAISAAVNFYRVLDHGLRTGKMFWRKGDIYYRALKVLPAQRCEKSLWPYTQKFDFPMLARKIKIPVLFIHGAKDQTIPVELAQESYEWLKSPKKMVVIPGAGHLFWQRAARDRLLEAVLKGLADFKKYGQF